MRGVDFPLGQPRPVRRRGADIPRGQRRVVRHDLTRSETSSQRIEYDGDEHPGPADTGLTMADRRIDRDPLQELFRGHRCSVALGDAGEAVGSGARKVGGSTSRASLQ